MSMRIILEECTGCKLCVRACPYGGMEVVEDKAHFTEKCNWCGGCVGACRPKAIRLDITFRKDLDLSAYRGLWVVAEQSEGQLRKGTLELLSEGRKLADQLQVELSAMLLGDEVAQLAQLLIAHGADRVYLAQDKVLRQYRTGPYADVICGLVNEHKPEIVLFSATAQGRDLAPRVAARLAAGLTADCTGLEIDPEARLLVQTRPAFGGNVMATIICPYARPQMATVRPGVFRVAPPEEGRKGEVISVSVFMQEAAVLTKIIEVAKLEQDGRVSLQDAQIIVSGGRGLGKPENFRLVRELAEALGGAVGASRAVVDAGWIPAYHQVGQTGKTVQPRLYIACGISGAVQHLAGMQSSDVIIAINKDPAAPIFDIATYGIVADCLEILPVLTAKVREGA